MIFGINTTWDISKLSTNFTRLTACEITYNNFEISLRVFMPNITTNHAITNTNFRGSRKSNLTSFSNFVFGHEKVSTPIN